MLNLALLGVGKWGSNILRTLEGMRGVKVIHTGTTPAEAKKILAAAGELAGVLIATPGSTHARVALPFIKKGLPVYIEKPLTTSLPDALRLQKAAQKSGSLVFAGHIHLYNPAYVAARKAAERAGKIRFLYFEGTNNGPFRDDMSAMWDWAPHDVYLALDLMKSLPTRVQAWGIKTLRPATTLYDFTVLKMMFPDGHEAISLTSWLLPKKQKKATIVGTRDTVVFDEAADPKVTVFKDMGPKVVGTRVTKQEPKITQPTYSPKLSLELELQAFIECIQTGKPPLSNITQGVNVIRILAAAEKSIRLDGKPVKL